MQRAVKKKLQFRVYDGLAMKREGHVDGGDHHQEIIGGRHALVVFLPLSEKDRLLGENLHPHTKKTGLWGLKSLKNE